MPGYVGDVATAYDRDLGHVLFQPYAIDIAWRATTRSVRHVLEIAVGTGIVTRQLRDALPGDALLTAIDICDSTVDVAGAKFLPPLPYEQVTFKLQLVECNALIVRKRCGQ